MEKRHILHVIPGLTIGGAEVDLIDKTTTLSREYGYCSTICCLRRRGDLASRAEQAGVKVLGPLMRSRYDVRGLARLRQLILSHPWSLVHTHLFVANLFGCLTSLTVPKVNRPPLIAAEHALAERWFSPDSKTTFSGQPIAEPQGRIALIADRWLIQHCTSLIVVPSRACAKSYIDRGIQPEKLKVISNAIDINRFEKVDRPASRHRVRKNLGIPPDAYVLGTVSRLEPFKGLPVLIRAMVDLPDYLLVAGDGPQRPFLAEQIHSRGLTDRVKLLGIRSDVPELLTAFDLFVLPSYADSFGIAVAEALLMKVPVVATDVGGIPEVTNGAECACLVAPGDTAALVKAILWMKDHPQEAQELARRGHRFIRKKMSLSTVTGNLHATYKQVIETSGS